MPPFDELPELTLSLRRLGSRRGMPIDLPALQEEQRKFFAPLLDARRAASQAVTRQQAVAAFDARRLTALVDAAVRGFAASRFPVRVPARRAFEAELAEIIEPLRKALAVLGDHAAQLARGVELPDQYDQWTLWLSQLQFVFRLADTSWQPLCEALTISARAQPVGWRGKGKGDKRR